MKRLFVLFCLSLCFGPAAPAQEPAKSPTIYFHHHSFFEIHSSAGTVVAIDPHAIEAYAGNPPPKIKADVVLLSHSHSDHTRVAARIENLKQAKIIPGYKGNASNLKWNLVDEKFKDVHIRSYGSYHDEEQGMKYGINTIFVIEVDGWKIAHLGDLGHMLTAKQIKEIGEVDVLMVPVGGIYSLNGSQASKLVKAMDVKEYILPMHYGTPQLQDTLTPDEFLEFWPQKQIARDKGNKLALNRDPQRPRPLVVLLHQEDKK